VVEGGPEPNLWPIDGEGLDGSEKQLPIARRNAAMGQTKTGKQE